LNLINDRMSAVKRVFKVMRRFGM